MSISIKLDNLSVKFDTSEDPILENISLKIYRGQVVGIIGKSGIGKSTLLKTINGIIPKRQNSLRQGKVSIMQRDIDTLTISELSQYIGTVFQNPDDQIVFPLVEDELAFGPENLCLNSEEIENRISKVLKMLNIEDLRLRNPNNLSGGEKQLVTIAAILCLGADIILFDEALSYLDSKGKRRVKDTLVELKKLGKTIIMVEHDYKNLSIADIVYELSSGKLTRCDNESL